MGTYVVERYLTGWSQDEVGALLIRLDELDALFEKRCVHYLNSIVLDADEVCLSVFAGADAESVRQTNDELGLPTDRVVAATFAAHREPTA
jgi:hypothetical protein